MKPAAYCCDNSRSCLRIRCVIELTFSTSRSNASSIACAASADENCVVLALSGRFVMADHGRHADLLALLKAACLLFIICLHLVSVRREEMLPRFVENATIKQDRASRSKSVYFGN